jgi:ATP phosphoribosyltransferase
MSEVETRGLRIAIPSKGRLHDQACELLRNAGLNFRRRERRLYSSVKNLDAAVIFANAADVPTLVSEGAVDLGISGEDLVREQGAVGIQQHLRLGFGRCRICVAVRERDAAAGMAWLAGKTIGTSFPRHAESFLATTGLTARLLSLNGSLEVMVALGLVDAIVELVETGDSLRDNQLVPIAEIAHSEAVLIGRAEPRHALHTTVVRRIEGVIIAQHYVLCEYNLPANALEQARQVTPGYNSPTVQHTSDPQTVAVKVMVLRSELVEKMDQLEALGATAIIVTPITNCRL